MMNYKQEQVNGIKQSCKLAASALNYITSYIVPGISTLKINNLIDEFIHLHGGKSAALNYKAFPKSICTSINNIACHGIPSNECIKEGDIIGVDVATVLNEWYGDTCFTFPVGVISTEANKLLKIARQALLIGIKEVKPGEYTGNIGQAISDYVYKRGYSIATLFHGHGVGSQFHEYPDIHHEAEIDSGVCMEPGMVFTIEPIINTGKSDISFEGWIAKTTDSGLSAQYEHTVLVTESGHEILTLSPLWL